MTHARFSTGLVSITFRAMQRHEIVDLAAGAKLDGIEWGGDVHVPHGDVAAARDAARITADAGLQTLCYGSYFRCRAGEDFEPVLASAVALGAPLIRIWAGERGSADSDEAAREAVAANARRACELAASAGIEVAFEFHGNTLTDTAASAQWLLRSVQGAQTLWQPHNEVPESVRLAGLELVLPRVANLHVFHWVGRSCQYPLVDGLPVWHERLRRLAYTGRNHALLLEFVRGDSPEQFLRDAATLKLLANGAGFGM